MIAKNKSQGRQLDPVNLKTPPHSHEAEQSVLGGLMIDANGWDKIADLINANDFYHNGHRIIYEAIAEMALSNKPLDYIALSDLLKAKRQMTAIGGESYLLELQRNTPSAANILTYGQIIRKYSVQRQLIQASNDINCDAFDTKGRDFTQLLDDAERRIFAIAEQNNRLNNKGPQNISSVLAQALTILDENQSKNSTLSGISSGFIDLDNKTSGLQPSDLIILAGRPSMGKTAFALNVAEEIVLGNDSKPVLIFSMEMPAEHLALRFISSLTSIDQLSLRTGNLKEGDWIRITQAITPLAEAPLYIDDTPALNPVELRSRARRVAREIQPKHDDLGLIIIDYLQLMNTHDQRENRATEIAAISRSLKALAKELHVPVMALSQLNRSLENRTEKRPIMSDLRESGSLEQDADLIMFIYRDEVYNENTTERNKAEIIIGKQRNGPIGTVNLYFDAHVTRFRNLSEQRQYGDSPSSPYENDY